MLTIKRSVSTSLWVMFFVTCMSFSTTFSTTTMTTNTPQLFDLSEPLRMEQMPTATQSQLSTRFQRLGRASSNELHTVVFKPTQLHQNELVDVLYEVSDPTSQKYGQFWSKDDLVTFTQNPTSIAFIKAFLSFHQISIVQETLHSEYIYAQASIATWEAVLHTEFHTFLSNTEGSTKVLQRCYEYSLPKVLYEHVAAVFNTIHMPVMKKLDRHIQEPSAVKLTANRQLSSDEQFPGYVTPSVIQSTYNVDISMGNNLVSQGLYESLNETMSPEDLTVFQEVFDLLVQPISGDSGHVSNQACHDSYNDCAEANLDVQYIMGVGQGIPTYYDYDNSPEDDFLLNWITIIANSSNPHTVYSISYGAYENEMPKSYIDAFDEEVIKLGIMGTSVLASSGDDGVAGFYARDDPSECQFAPQYPASSPFVTAVGGTNGPQNNSPEVACQSDVATKVKITTGGGFSNYYTAPPYQQDYINTYFNKMQGSVEAPIPGYNRTGRGYPDISLLAHNYFVVLNVTAVGVDGTSASSPVMAALVNLINAQRKAAGLSTLGFLNPILYAKSMYYVNDITSGSNFCTALYYNTTTKHYASTCCNEGFYTATGWDPVTGLGSLNFQKLNAAVGVTVIGNANDDDNSISGGDIAGIVIGTVVGLLLMAGVIMYYRNRGQWKHRPALPMQRGADSESFDDGTFL